MFLTNTCISTLVVILKNSITGWIGHIFSPTILILATQIRDHMSNKEKGKIIFTLFIKSNNYSMTPQLYLDQITLHKSIMSLILRIHLKTNHSNK